MTPIRRLPRHNVILKERMVCTEAERASIHLKKAGQGWNQVVILSLGHDSLPIQATISTPLTVFEASIAIVVEIEANVTAGLMYSCTGQIVRKEVLVFGSIVCTWLSGF